VGKTRLAIEAASDLDAGFDTVAFVPLASVGGPELVVATIARAVGLQSTERRPQPPWLPTFDRGRCCSSSTASSICWERWQTRLEELGVKHGGIAEDANGLGLSFRDPDNIALELWAPRS
jgi:hypothetical protein